jgi:DNA-binding LacI/PurR family transcriptional regulator
MALGALNAARAARLRVPADLTVVGFGDTGAAEHAAPALTTVSMPRHQLGVAAMQALLGALAGKTTQVEPRQLPFKIVLRDSSAPPAAGTQTQEERIA